jgi:glycosyltransferase involved in cell wall biosynthesis
MKILVISQQYWPESWRIVDTCEFLVAHGNDVTVMCGRPNDQSGRLLSTYKERKTLFEERNGVQIIRISDSPREKGDFRLYLKYMSFVNKANRQVKTLPSDFDIVLVNQLSPVMQAIPAIRYSDQHHCPILMYCQDIWPESLSARGVRNSGLTKPVYQHYWRKSKRIYQRMDRILVTSPSYVSYLHEHCGVDPKKIDCLPQFSESLFFQDAKPTLDKATKHNFVFAGNVGFAQDVETIARAAYELKQYPDISFHVFGDGSDLSSVKKIVTNLALTNIVFHSRVPTNQLPGVYASADGLLLTFGKLAFTRYVLPAKLTTYMAAAKPVLVAGDGASADLVKKVGCGIAVPSGDYVGLASEVLKMAQRSETQKNEMGIKGREYAKQAFDRNAYYAKLIKELKSLSKQK